MTIIIIFAVFIAIIYIISIIFSIYAIIYGLKINDNDKIALGIIGLFIILVGILAFCIHKDAQKKFIKNLKNKNKPS